MRDLLRSRAPQVTEVPCCIEVPYGTKVYGLLIPPKLNWRQNRPSFSVLLTPFQPACNLNVSSIRQRWLSDPSAMALMRCLPGLYAIVLMEVVDVLTDRTSMLWPSSGVERRMRPQHVVCFSIRRMGLIIVKIVSDCDPHRFHASE